MRRLELVVQLAGLMLALVVVEGVPLRHGELLLIDTFVWLRCRETFWRQSTGLSAASIKPYVAALLMSLLMWLVHRRGSKN